MDWRKDLIEVLERHLRANPPSGRLLFNIYTQNDEYDRKGGNEIRWKNLVRYVEMFEAKPRFLLIGEAPGFRGCRFSGVPFTSERQLLQGVPVRGEKSSFGKAPYSERTAEAFWKTLAGHRMGFFVWNVVPFHPFRGDDKTCNRTPKWQEIELFLPLLDELFIILEPEILVSVGRTAEHTLKKLGYASHYVRHPARGGEKTFAEQVVKLVDSHEIRFGDLDLKGNCNERQKQT